jgi:hypothetical protein
MARCNRARWLAAALAAAAAAASVAAAARPALRKDTAAAAAGNVSVPLPFWNQPFLDPLVFPYGGAPLLANVTWQRVYFAEPAIGTYAMSPMLDYFGSFLMVWYKLSPENEVCIPPCLLVPTHP